MIRGGHRVRVHAVERRREDAAPKETRTGEQRRDRESGCEHEEDAKERAVDHQRHELPLRTRASTRLLRRYLLVQVLYEYLHLILHILVQSNSIELSGRSVLWSIL